MVNVVSAASIMDDMLGDIKESDNPLYPFKVRVGVIKYRSPRHKFFEYIRDMGSGDIDRVFDCRSFRNKDLVFVFPERWMSVHEQRNFMHYLNKHPDADSLESVDVITSSPIMIGDFAHEMIRIITWPDEEEENKRFK
jgi:hypothetical protein